MATVSQPDDPNVLGQLREEVLATIDEEIDEQLIDRWINRALEYLSGRKEWSFFFQKVKGVIGAADSRGFRTLPLPTDMKKLFSVETFVDLLVSGSSGNTRTPGTIEFQQGPDFDLFWNASRKAFDAIFHPLVVNDQTSQQQIIDASAPVDADIFYYISPSRLLQDDDQTRWPVWFIDTVIQMVLVKCYKKLGDLVEMRVTMQDIEKTIKEQIDDDAREPSLPSQMRPNKNQSQDEYDGYLDSQKFNFQTNYQRYF